MGGFVNYQIKKGLLLSVRVKKKLKSMNIWQSYKQKRDCLMHFACRANALLKDEESAPCIQARRVATKLENLKNPEYSGISLNMEHSGNSQ